MNDKDFDKYIKDKLVDFHSDTSSDWEETGESLIEESLSDEIFDKSLKDEFEKIRAPFNKSHWSLLREKLLTEAYLKKRLYTVKIAEILFLFLFVWVTLSIVPLKRKLYNVHDYRPITSQLALLFSNTPKAKTLYKDSRVITKPKVETSYNTFSQDGDDNTFKWPYLDSSNSENTDFKNSSTTALLPKSYYDELDLKDRFVKVPEIADFTTTPMPDNDAHTVLSFSAGVTKNYLDAPSQGSIGINPIEYGHKGYHIEATIGKRKGDFETFSGISFYNVSYDPSTSIGLINNLNNKTIPISEIDNISYTFFNIPLGIRYHMVEGDNWSLFAMSAININLKATTKYTLNPLSAEEKKLAELDPSSYGGSIFLRSPFGEKNEYGILQGGGIKENISLSATLGLGLVKSINDTFDFYIQPSYTRNFSVDGSGAQDERIDNFRLDLGTRLSF